VATASWFGCQGQPNFLENPPQSSNTVELAAGGGRELDEVVPGSYLVMFKSTTSDSTRFFASFFDEFQYHYLSLADDFLADSRIKSIDILDATDLSTLKSNDIGWKADFNPPAAMQLFWQERPSDIVSGVMTRVDFESPEAAEVVLKEWEFQGRIWYAEPNGVTRMSSTWPEISTDYGAGNLEWHKQIGLIDALGELAGNSAAISPDDILLNPPIIAILDSGTDYEHPSLKDNIWENSQPGASGCEGDVRGCDTTSPSKGSLGNGNVWPVGASGPGEAVEGQGRHGTHVAGIIAGKIGSDIGGVCPVCKIMTVKVAEIEGNSPSASPGITDDSQIRGLKYVTRFTSSNASAVRIVNSSFGKYTRSKSVAILIDALKKSGSGTMIIAAASNEDSMIRSYPAALANAVAVSALDQSLKKASFSNFGPWVDISAPGDKIVSTVPGGDTAESSGTSMAAPVVAGAAGLMLAMNPSLNFAEIRNRILNCADSRIYSDDSPGPQFNSANYFPKIDGEDARRPLLGSGIVNVKNMIAKTCSNSIGRPLDRVTPGCSTVSRTSSVPWSASILVFFALFPLIAIVFSRVKM
jgi:hypothetical protein